MYYVCYEYNDKRRLYTSTYDECKEYIRNHYSDDLCIVSIETGRLMSIVW